MPVVKMPFKPTKAEQGEILEILQKLTKGNKKWLRSDNPLVSPDGEPGANQPGTSSRTPNKAIDEIIDACGLLPPIISGSTSLGQTSRQVIANGVPYDVVEERYRLVVDVIEHSYLKDVSAQVWPGAIIQGRGLLSGDVAEIRLPHGPGSFQITTDFVTKTPKSQSRSITKPTADSVARARREILQQINPTDSAGIINTNFMQAETLREVAVKLGVDIRGGSFGVQVDGSYDRSYQSSTVVASIRQTFYVCKFDPDGIASLAFDTSVKPEELQRFIGSGNPPLMIESVHYGRVIVVAATAKSSSEELGIALRAHWEASVSGNVGGAFQYKEVLQSAQVRVYTVGTVLETAPTVLSNPVGQLDSVYRAGLTFTLENPGAPIAFTARHLKDGSQAHVDLVAEYVEPVRTVAQDVNTDFKIFDGPGGGFKDTGIDVAPGDFVQISAHGRTFSGVKATGTTGPDGWTNWAAPEGWPAPGENVHCLLARFGTGVWGKVGNYWEGTSPLPTTARLQLNINDNEQENGDPNQAFTVKVQVVRRNAGAAGLYV